MTDELLVNIGKHITSPNWTHTASWEIQKLSELGQLTQENAAIINKWIKAIPKELRDTMEETRRLALERIEKQMEQAMKTGAVTPPETDSSVAVLRDLRDQAANRMNLVNTTMLQSSVDQYQRAITLTEQEYGRLMAQREATQEALNEGAANVAAGVETRRTAVRRAIGKVAAEGLTGFVDRAGRQWSPEAYVNMDIRTTVHNTAIQATRARMDDFGTQVFQISSHAGARPLCYPYQGKFYSWDNTEGDIELGDGSVVHYEPINRTSYGQPAGIFGINCGHYPIPIVAGITIPHGADNIQPPEENDKAYAESQEQRALERKIRAAKRVVEMAGDSATPEDKAAVKDAQAQMREFIKRTGRTRRYDREQIGGTPQTPRTPQPAPKPEPTPETERINVVAPLTTEPQKADTVQGPTFIPATSKKEAAEYASRFAGTVDFSGVSLENANAINERLTYLMDKYPINTLHQLGGKANRGAVMSANYHDLFINGSKLGKALSDESLNFAMNRAMNEASLRILQQRYPNGKYPPDVQRQIDRLNDKMRFTRYGVQASYENHVGAVVTHEYGHILSDQYFGMINKERANPNYADNWQLRGMTSKWETAFQKARESGDIYSLSEYGNTNVREFFAECFVARDMGETLPDYVEELMQEVLTRGIM
jgi:hypothetical protein